MLKKAICLTFLSLAPLLAGGFWVEAGNASAEAKAKGAVMVVRAVGCGQPANATLRATAEGVVDGKRQTLPVTLEPLSTPGAYAVKRSWPEGGKWVVAVLGEYEGHFTSNIVPITDNGIDRKQAKLASRKFTPEEVEASLQKMD